MSEMTRRDILGGTPRPKLAPRAELVNAFEFAEQAKLVLPATVFATIAGGDHQPFDKITFRQRVNRPTLDMDLSVELLGQTLFTPIVVGPISEQAQYHPEGELATLHGATAANTLVIMSSRTSVPLEKIAAEAKTPFWINVYAGPDGQKQAQSAVSAGAKAIFITVGASYQATGGKSVPAKATGKIDWSQIDTIRRGLDVPVVVKGVTSVDEAKAALQLGVQGIVVSNFGGLLGASQVAPLDTLASIVDTAGGRVPVLIDGSVRRGTCVLKALALGARAVLVGRPIAWGLASYGADGVQSVIELIQSELGRSIGMLGVSKPQDLTREHVRVHKRATA